MSTQNFATKYNFRTDKVGNKRDAMELVLQRPTADALVNILTDGKGKAYDLLIEAVENVIYGEAALAIRDFAKIGKSNEGILAELAKLDLSWEAIAAQEREGRGSAFSKEDMQAFVEDYIDAMPAITGKDVTRVSKAAALFKAKFTTCKSDMDTLAILEQQLSLYVQEAANAAQHGTVIEYLSKRLAELQQPEVKLSEAL